MKTPLFLATAIVFTTVATAQTPVRFAAASVQNARRIVNEDHHIDSQPLVLLRGNVRITTAAGTIQADEADYNPVTNETELRGHVTMRLSTRPVVSR